MGAFETRMDAKISEMIDILEKVKDLPEMDEAAGAIAAAFENGHRLTAWGNGGSGANADQMVGEFVGRFRYDRKPFAAFSMPGVSGLTCIANDFGYDQVMARQVRGILGKGDVFVAYSCSGMSPNVLEAVRAAKEKGVTSIGFSGRAGKLYKMVDIPIRVPPCNWQTLEEVHLILTHLLCEMAEERLCAKDPSARRIH